MARPLSRGWRDPDRFARDSWWPWCPLREELRLLRRLMVRSRGGQPRDLTPRCDEGVVSDGVFSPLLPITDCIETVCEISRRIGQPTEATHEPCSFSLTTLFKCSNEVKGGLPNSHSPICCRV